jgi:putative lipoprotein
MKKRLYISILVSAVWILSGCNKFLDHMPDNRTEINTEEKIVALLTSAYPQNTYIVLTEMSSDNEDDYILSFQASDRFYDQIFTWQDITEDDNDSPEQLWNASYKSIAAANQALRSIENLGGATTQTLREAKAEALLCRAYNHFILTNVFCLAYNGVTSGTDPGIPYTLEPEETLNPQYTRGTVAEDYALMEEDILEALETIGDGNYKVPKYHFNTKAAYAFAARFFLYYEKWDKAAEFATKCLGNEPKSMLRDWKSMADLSYEPDVIWNAYIQTESNTNLLLMAPYSGVGFVFGPYSSVNRYSHGAYLSATETYKSQQIWGNAEYQLRVATYIGAMDREIQWKLPYKFEFSDPVAQIGFTHTVYPALWSDECLLNRAEAYIMLEDYDAAAKDMTLWINNMTTSSGNYSATDIVNFYNGLEYTSWEGKDYVWTPKKHLNPKFDIGEEGGKKEAMLQCLLSLRRIETIGQGMRWFDIKRYGIEIPRRRMSRAGSVLRVTDVLTKDDNRRALQLPLKVISAGLPANVRTNKADMGDTGTDTDNQ